MKTLDEVVKKIEAAWVCPSSDEADEYCELYEVRHEALRYLKEYKQEKENLIEAQCKYRDAEEKLGAQKAQMMWVDKHFKFEEPNEPLTWQEINDLYHGEPVWIEWNDDDPDTPEEDWDGDWFLALYCVNNPVLFIALSKNEYRQYFYQDYLGKRWKAYRRRK